MAQEMSFEYCLLISMIAGTITVFSGNEGMRMQVGGWDGSPTKALGRVGRGLARTAKSGIHHCRRTSSSSPADSSRTSWTLWASMGTYDFFSALSCLTTYS